MPTLPRNQRHASASPTHYQSISVLQRVPPPSYHHYQNTNDSLPNKKEIDAKSDDTFPPLLNSSSFNKTSRMPSATPEKNQQFYAESPPQENNENENTMNTNNPPNASHVLTSAERSFSSVSSTCHQISSRNSSFTRKTVNTNATNSAIADKNAAASPPPPPPVTPPLLLPAAASSSSSLHSNSNNNTTKSNGRLPQDTNQVQQAVNETSTTPVHYRDYNRVPMSRRPVDASPMRRHPSLPSKPSRRSLSRTNQRRYPSNDEYLYRQRQQKRHHSNRNADEYNNQNNPTTDPSFRPAGSTQPRSANGRHFKEGDDNRGAERERGGEERSDRERERERERGASYYGRAVERGQQRYDRNHDPVPEDITIDIPSLRTACSSRKRRNLVRPVSRYERRGEQRRRETRRPHAADIMAYRGVAGSTVRSLVENILVKPAKSCLNLEFDERGGRLHHTHHHDVTTGGNAGGRDPSEGGGGGRGHHHHNGSSRHHRASYCCNNYYHNDACDGEGTSQDTVPLYPMYQLPENEECEGPPEKIIEKRKKGNLEPVTLTFKNLRFSIPNPKKKSGENVILEPISGVFRPGEMVAIMGPSGCGKTTLLDMLAQKKTAKYTGEVYVNGQRRDQFFKRIATYVSQDELYNGNEKVREVLEFSSRLRMNYAWTGMGEELRQKNIDETLEYLGLDHVQNSRVGNSVVRGVSGGQKRRLTLGRGVLSDAYIGFCDEPTSGLSPSDTELVLQAIKNMAQLYQMIFVIVIHQPRWEAFQKFDKFILLSSGRCIYNGPANKAQTYFSKLGFVCPPQLNPADFFLDLVTPGFPGACPERLADYYAKHMAPKVMKQVEKSLTEQHPPISEAIKSGPGESSDHMYAVTRWTQFKLVTKRFLQYWRRDTATIESILTNAILQAVLVGLVFFSVRSDRTVFQQLSSIFLIGIFVLLSTLSNVPLIVSQREQYVYEVGDAYYSPLPYLCSQQMTCYTVLLFCNTLMVTIAWSLMGFEWTHFPFALLIILLAYIAMDGLVSIFALSAENFAQANSAASFCLMFTAIFNGFNSNPNSMPMWFGWVSYLSPFFYLFEGLSIQLFEEYDFDEYLKRNPNELIYTSVDMVWETYGMAGRAYGNTMNVRTYKWVVDVGMLFIMAITARLCTMLYQANCVRLKK